MSIVKMRDMLKDAEEHGYGVPAINIFNYESAKYAVRAAEEAKMPIIIQLYPGFERHIPLKIAVDMVHDLAVKADVPVTMHEDHSNYAQAVKGIGAGFESVMIDGSALPYDENVALTRSVVDLAAGGGIDVEAELGHVGTGSNVDDFTDRGKFTDPDQAVDFVEKTKCSSLAVAVGNAHGNYAKLPVLDFERIAELRKKLSVPLVMHGGSDIPFEQMQKAVLFGMSKFNIATEYQRCFYRNAAKFYASGEGRDVYLTGLMALEEPCKEFVKGKIAMLNPKGYRLG